MNWLVGITPPLFLMFCVVFKKEKYLKDSKLSNHNAPVKLFLPP